MEVDEDRKMNKFKSADGDACNRTPTVAKDGLTNKEAIQRDAPNR